MLHQLRNGTWIDLMYVRRIEVMPMVSPDHAIETARHPRVSVITSEPTKLHDATTQTQVTFDALADAEAHRDELAGLVNAARQEAAGKAADGRPKPML